jgi:hypothetical protein
MIFGAQYVWGPIRFAGFNPTCSPFGVQSDLQGPRNWCFKRGCEIFVVLGGEREYKRCAGLDGLSLVFVPLFSALCVVVFGFKGAL